MCSGCCLDGGSYVGQVHVIQKGNAARCSHHTDAKWFAGVEVGCGLIFCVWGDVRLAVNVRIIHNYTVISLDNHRHIFTNFDPFLRADLSTPPSTPLPPCKSRPEVSVSGFGGVALCDLG